MAAARILKFTIRVFLQVAATSLKKDIIFE